MKSKSCSNSVESAIDFKCNNYSIKKPVNGFCSQRHHKPFETTFFEKFSKLKRKPSNFRSSQNPAQKCFRKL